MNRKHSRYLATMLTMAVAAIGAGPSVADSMSDPPSVIVRYRPADLARDEGVQALYSRLKTAARRVCDLGEHRELVQRAAFQRCTDKALGDAVATLGNPRVAALHSRGGRPPEATRIAGVER